MFYSGFAGMSPLMEAVLIESSDCVKILASRFPLDDQGNLLGLSALHLAVFRPQHVDTLLNLGANVDARDKYGITPLMYAATLRKPEVAIRLLEFGADPFLTAGRTQNFLQFALARGGSNTFEGILKHVYQFPNTSKFLSRDILALGLVALIFEEYDLSGKVPKLFQDLLEWGADPDVICFDHRGHLAGTLLHHVRDIPTVKSIIFHGFTRFNYPDQTGAHALYSSYVRPNSTLMELLIDGGSCVNHQNNKGETTLHMVTQHMKADITGFDIADQRGYEDRTRVIDCIRLLLNRGADSCLGDTSQCACSRNGCTPSNRLLKEHVMMSSSRRDIWALEFYATVEEVCGCETAKWCLLDMLRLVKFEELEITHTCLQESFFFNLLDDKTAIDDEEVEEIRDEEKITIQGLEQEMLGIEKLSRDELEQLLLSAISRRKWDRELEARSLMPYHGDPVSCARTNNRGGQSSH
jgi:ankyrin repeat protein